MARAQGLGAGEVLISSPVLDEWRDVVYRLASALEDVDQDLAGEATLKSYIEAFLHLHNAASETTRFTIEPLAIGD